MSDSPIDNHVDTQNNEYEPYYDDSPPDFYVSDKTYMCFSTSNPAEKTPKTQEDALKCQKTSKCACVERKVTCILGSDSASQFVRFVRKASWAKGCDPSVCSCSNQSNYKARALNLLNGDTTLYDEKFRPWKTSDV